MTFVLGVELTDNVVHEPALVHKVTSGALITIGVPSVRVPLMHATQELPAVAQTVYGVEEVGLSIIVLVPVIMVWFGGFPIFQVYTLFIAPLAVKVFEIPEQI